MTGPVLDTINGLLDLIYPQRCLVCDSLSTPYLCSSCVSRIEHVPRPYCEKCGHPKVGFRCRNCWGRVNSFITARAAGRYSGVLREAIHRFKYGGHRMLAAPLAELLHRYLDRHADFPWRRAECIVPVPIHPARFRLRGYNQSELLAERLSELTGLPLVKGGLVRRRWTHPQVDLQLERRRGNVKAAFDVRDRSAFAGKTVLLVDDVATSCATVHECSLSLLKAGAARVYVLCLAFGT